MVAELSVLADLCAVRSLEPNSRSLSMRFLPAEFVFVLFVVLVLFVVFVVFLLILFARGSG